MATPEQLVQDLYAAFGRGDVPFIVNLLAEDAVWDHPRGQDIPWGGARKGKAEITGFFVALGGGVDVEMFEPARFVCAGDSVIVLGRERMRVKATGRAYSTEWAHAWTVRDGKVTAFREYTDTASIVDALRA